MPLTSNVNVQVGASLTAPVGVGTTSHSVNKGYASAFTDGVLAGKADKLYSATRTLAASATEDLDLAGVLIDALGSTFTVARLKGLIISAAAANTNDVLVGGATTNGFVTWVGGAAHQVRVRPGGFFVLSVGVADLAGYAVTAATGDLLRVGNSGAGTPITYDIVLLGASA